MDLVGTDLFFLKLVKDFVSFIVQKKTDFLGETIIIVGNETFLLLLILHLNV